MLNNQAYLIELLESYLPVNLEEQVYKARFIEFIKGEPECLNRDLLKGHITVSVWLTDSTLSRVLLTHHKKINRWIQLGGHADGDPDLFRVALKEALEESGIPMLEFVKKRVFDIDIHQIPEFDEYPQHLHYDVRFLIRTTISDRYIVSDESIDLKWVNIQEIENFTTEPSIIRMAQKSLALNL